MAQRRIFLWSIILLVGALSLTGCGSSSDDAAPAPAPTGTFTKFATLDGTQAGTVTTANGTGSLTVDTATGAASGSLIIQTAPSATPVAAHVHDGATGVSGGVQVTLTSSGGGVWSVPANTVLTAAQIASFSAGNLYYAMHTGAPGEPATGLIRGQIDKSTATLYARLDGTQETPAPITTSAAGTGSLTVNADTGVVTGSLTVTVAPATAISAAHVHNGDRGIGGPVLIPLTDSGNGVWSVPANATPLTQAERGLFIAGNLYYNVHTAAVGGFPSGEIRGQLDLIAP
jgi:hypothetical protein